MMPTYLSAAIALSVVMLVMALLTALLYAARFVANRPAAGGEPQDGRAAAEGIDEETMAVLVAAAHTALGSAIRIHHVHLHHDRRREGWSRAGRMDIMLSHRLGPLR